MFERIVEISPAFDKRHPDPAKNYGIGSCGLRMVLKDERGAVQFLLYTGWNLPHLPTSDPLAADLGYHSPVPRWEGQEPIDENCLWLDGPCYYDGSGLNAQRVYEVLLTEGSDGVWRELEQYHAEVFGEQP